MTPQPTENLNQFKARLIKAVEAGEMDAETAFHEYEDAYTREEA